MALQTRLLRLENNRNVNEKIQVEIANKRK